MRSSNSDGIGELLGALIAAPFVLLGGWFDWIRQQPAGQQELAKACHGIGMLALLVLFCSWAGGFFAYLDALRRADSFFYWIPLPIAAWGIGWFLLNASFAAQAVTRPHRATLIVRAVIKIGVGYAAWMGAQLAPPHGLSDIALFGWVLVPLPLSVASVWCLSTGVTKLTLMLWGGPRRDAYPVVLGDIEANEFDWDR